MGLVIIYCISFQMFAINEELLMKGGALKQTLRWTIVRQTLGQTLGRTF